jgi:ubiquinone/menaquinone biosynthesis C-methylase UbiE
MDIANPSPLTAFVITAYDNTVGASAYRRYFGEVTSMLKGDEHVLELGSGWGIGSRCLAQHLLKRNGRLTCVDISDYWIERTRKRLKRFPNIDFVLGDITKLNIPDTSHDAVVIRNTLHEIAPERRHDTLKATVRTLKPDGTLFIREPTSEGHGIPAEEIRRLVTASGLVETESVEEKKAYRGVFRKTG